MRRTEALRLLLGEQAQPMLLVVSEEGDKMQGIVTKTDILQALKMRGRAPGRAAGKALPPLMARRSDVV